MSLIHRGLRPPAAVRVPGAKNSSELTLCSRSFRVFSAFCLVEHCEHLPSCSRIAFGSPVGLIAGVAVAVGPQLQQRSALCITVQERAIVPRADVLSSASSSSHQHQPQCACGRQQCPTAGSDSCHHTSTLRHVTTSSSHFQQQRSLQ